LWSGGSSALNHAALLVHAAVGGEDGRVPIRANPRWPAGSHVSHDRNGRYSAPAVSIASRLRANGLGAIDVLKCFTRAAA